ncbi:amidohydrolase [Sphingomonas lycopersici]|uniref:Amidohydrolase n=1 Tax=Sphingomonas lycopersici TaxID=2951807 RepID=A0AA41ZC42_9SPHN|nr:amidohydrolase [Sphingomonas lycopersici]MCW6533906.1 amidohydrolase [Sphingomonas lycopersici]
MIAGSKRRFAGTCSVFVLMCCAADVAASPSGTAKLSADMILYNGKVLTVDSKFSTKTVIVISDGKIVATGGKELLRRYRAGQEIDLRGRVAMPGFMDTHFHPSAISHRAIDASTAGSIEELKKMVAAKAAELGPGEWVTGAGWAEDRFAERRNPTRRDLDEAAPNNPVAIHRAGGHSIVGNSMALKLAHLDRTSPNPERGVFERDQDGELNGIIRERTNIYVSLVPPDSPSALRDGYIADLRRLTRLGITSLIVASASIGDEVDEVLRPEMPKTALTFRQLQDIYALKGYDLPRASVEISYPGHDALARYPHKTGYGDDRLRLGAIGEMPAVDGGFTGPTAWTTRPYRGQPDFHGQPFFKDESDLEALATDVADRGWQLGLHAIGDAAIDMATRVYARVIEKHKLTDHRWYLAHYTMLPSEDSIALMRRDAIWASAQPNFLYNLEVRYLQTLDGAALEHNNPVAVPAARGVSFAFGSDNLPVDPRVGLYAAVTRRGPSGRVYGKEEAVSIEKAISYYTAAGPFLTHEEKLKGTLEPGKLADLIVLDSDPTAIAPENLLTMQIDLTIVGGRVVYDRSKGN